MLLVLCQGAPVGGAHEVGEEEDSAQVSLPDSKRHIGVDVANTHIYRYQIKSAALAVGSFRELLLHDRNSINTTQERPRSTATNATV